MELLKASVAAPSEYASFCDPEVPGTPTAEDLVKRIAKRYRVERKLRDIPELDCAAPVSEGIKSVLEAERFRQLPQSNMGKAINHTFEH